MAIDGKLQSLRSLLRAMHRGTVLTKITTWQTKWFGVGWAGKQSGLVLVGQANKVVWCWLGRQIKWFGVGWAGKQSGLALVGQANKITTCWLGRQIKWFGVGQETKKKPVC
jgi:hypothetical protein